MVYGDSRRLDKDYRTLFDAAWPGMEAQEREVDRIIRSHGGTGTSSATESESGSSSCATANDDIPGHTEEEWENADNLSLSLEEDRNQRENLVINLRWNTVKQRGGVYVARIRLRILARRASVLCWHVSITTFFADLSTSRRLPIELSMDSIYLAIAGTIFKMMTSSGSSVQHLEKRQGGRSHPRHFLPNPASLGTTGPRSLRPL